MAWSLTSISAPGQHVPLAHGPFELRCRSVDQSAGLSSLGLGPPAVAELGANYQETFRRWLRGNQPIGRIHLLPQKGLMTSPLMPQK